MSGKGCVYMSMHAASVVNDMPRKSLVAGTSAASSASPTANNGLQNSTSNPSKRMATPPSYNTDNNINLEVESGATATTTSTNTIPTGAAPPNMNMNPKDKADPSSDSEGGFNGKAKPAPAQNMPGRPPEAPHQVSNTQSNQGNSSSTQQQPLRQRAQHAQAGGGVQSTNAVTASAPVTSRQQKQGDSMDEDSVLDSDDSSISTSSSYDSADDDSCSSGSSSWSSSSSTGSGPQHLESMEENMHPDLEYAVIATRKKGMLLSRLSEVSTRGTLALINFARRGLGANDVALIEQVILENPTLSVLKLGDNDLGDIGAHCIANALCKEVDGVFEHRPLRVLDLSFNGIGDDGCEALAVKAVAGNYYLRTLFLAGNNIGEKGTLSIAGALVHGCSLSRLHLSANKIGPEGVKGLATAVAEVDARLIAQESSEPQNAIAETADISNHGTKGISQRMEHLFLGSTSMESTGFNAIPSMLLTNTSLKVLCLTDNGITDQDMQVLAQALTQNKNVPLESIMLSFNEITCAGVECLMNAIWGSQTLREIKLDNNNMKDRGAQLCAVVLTSVKLEKLDIGFNPVSTVGIRALMKSLSEDTNVTTLGMSGIPIDLNAAKAISFALAYNSVIKTVYMDNCQVGYSAQRHIVAGIVSNQRAPLECLTGYPIGPITVTLGMPQLPEEWSNEQVLAFVRMMWRNWGKKRGPQTGEGGGDEPEVQEVKGPAPPAAVAAAAKIAFAALGSDPTAALYVEPRRQSAASYDNDFGELHTPLAPTNAALIERTTSGRLQVPGASNAEDGDQDGFLEAWMEGSALGRPAINYTVTGGSGFEAPLDNPEQRNRNLRWLRTHFRPLIDVGKLPFNNADMWQLHQYYFSPPYFADDVKDSKPAADDTAEDSTPSAKDPTASEKRAKTKSKKDKKLVAPPSTPVTGEKANKSNEMGRAVSFQTLSSAVAAAGLNSGSHKRRGHGDEEADEPSQETAPTTKRSKSYKPRIAYYPRIRAKLESLGTKPLEQTLSLLRKLKYVENVIFPEHTAYEELDRLRESENATRLDVEMILLDLI